MNQDAAPALDSYGGHVDEILERVTGGRFDPDVNLFENGALDSLKLINLILELEECFGVSIADQTLNFESFKSKQNICIELQRLTAGPSGQPD